jgi:hypothetical protein
MLFGDPRPAQPTPCGFAPFRAREEQGEAYKTGELAENRRFLKSRKAGISPAFVARWLQAQRFFLTDISASTQVTAAAAAPEMPTVMWKLMPAASVPFELIQSPQISMQNSSSSVITEKMTVITLNMSPSPTLRPA